MILKAGQLIFGNVEKARSPTKTEGFQTLSYTHSMLTEEEVVKIEGKLVYHAVDTEPVKWLFFRVGDWKVVMGRVVPQDQVDRHRRRSGFSLGHCFILSTEDFARIGCNPFYFFKRRGDEFIGSLEQALEITARTGANILESTIEIADEKLAEFEAEMIQKAPKWEPRELQRLMACAVASPELQKEQVSMALGGAPEAVQSALMVAFSLIPAPLRLNCGFDTHSYKCNKVGNYLWGRGYPSLTDSEPEFILVDAGERRVKEKVPSPDTPYWKWLSAAIEGQKFPDIAKNRETVFQLQKLLLGQEWDRKALDDTSEELAADFLAVNWPFVPVRIEMNLRASIGPNVAHRLVDGAAAARTAPRRGILLALSEGFGIDSVVELAVSLFGKQRPAAPELAELDALAVRSGDKLLKSLVAFWNADYPRVREELLRAPDETYRTAVELLVGQGIHPAYLVATGRAEILVEVFAALTPSPVRTQQIPELVARLVKAHEESALDMLAPWLKNLEPRDLKVVAKVVKKQARVPQPFLNSLRLAQSRPPSGIRGIIGALRGMRPDRESPAQKGDKPSKTS